MPAVFVFNNADRVRVQHKRSFHGAGRIRPPPVGASRGFSGVLDNCAGCTLAWSDAADRLSLGGIGKLAFGQDRPSMAIRKVCGAEMDRIQAVGAAPAQLQPLTLMGVVHSGFAAIAA